MTVERFGPSVDPEVRQEVRDKRKLRERQQEADVMHVMSHPAGQRFVAAIIDDCGLYKANPDMGKRSVALGLRELALRCDPTVWRAIEAEVIARRITPTNKPKENSDE